ncbi:MAG: sensor histidine kinase [Eubacterium sp.]|nr:sensor histidine kinase [Eubacterium sp.]
MGSSFENVSVDGNTICIYRMKNQYCVSDFIRAMQKAIRYTNRKTVEDKRIFVDCTTVIGRVFPDACVPIAALIQEYRNLYSLEIYVTVKKRSYLEKICFESPLNLNEDEIISACDPFDRIYIYESKDGGSPQAAAINQAIVNKLSSTALCEEGVLKGLNWCVYEVMDNVLIHSTSKHGYIMAQYHNKTNRIAIRIYDYGIGIHDSLITGGVYEDDEIKSIELALQEGIGDGQGQGNGLFGLSQIVSENGGRLAISTGNQR